MAGGQLIGERVWCCVSYISSHYTFHSTKTVVALVTVPTYFLQHKMGFGASGMPPNSSPLQVGYGGATSPGMPPGSGPGMGPPGSLHHHTGMGSPMGPPPSGHHHPGMGPPPPSGPGMSMGPPSSASTSGGSTGPMVVSAPTSIPPTVAASTPSPVPNSHMHHDGPGPMPPPPSTSNSHPPHHAMPGGSHAADMGCAPDPSHDNGLTNTSSGTFHNLCVCTVARL